jgi:hypothetical protein
MPLAVYVSLKVGYRVVNHKKGRVVVHAMKARRLEQSYGAAHSRPLHWMVVSGQLHVTTNLPPVPI